MIDVWSTAFICLDSASNVLLRRMRSIILAIFYMTLFTAGDANYDYYVSNGDFVCYSCMSKDKEEAWSYLQYVYYPPANFTNNCNRPMITYAMGVRPCTSACVTITEMKIVSGHFVGYSFTRGCINSIARNGFRNTTLREYHFELRPTCERLPRNAIFYRSNPTIEDQVSFCTCFGDRCNDDRNAGNSNRFSYHYDGGLKFLPCVSLFLNTKQIELLLVRLHSLLPAIVMLLWSYIFSIP